ncbi:MAG: SRPBCC family protein [Actinobacteria bacterium]|nr:SRPBCC family protein [Actinomycetota bacterium]
MDLSETVRTGAAPEELYDLVSDLANYPQWLGLVVRADREDETSGDARGSWMVELRGRVGPLARSKRLRMIRTCEDRPRFVRFERDEIDVRDHAPWRLEAEIDPDGAGSTLTMRLHYGGNLFGPVLAPILRDEIRQGRQVVKERFPPSD